MGNLISRNVPESTLQHIQTPRPPQPDHRDATTLTTAVLDMEAAYLDAEGRTSPDFTELGAGEIGGMTLAPGLYKWGTPLLISTDVTLSGGPDDVWIFQVAGTFNQANGKQVTLAGGAQAKNIFWQVAGAVTIGTTAHLDIDGHCGLPASVLQRV
ncbi:MAG: ice-binding family protein [Pseudomonadota bacterium]|nr:ice-binding family protein [Pseudomonadota bacterium]